MHLSEMELKQLIQGGETNSVELKIAAPRAVDLVERLRGMSYAGGEKRPGSFAPVIPGLSCARFPRSTSLFGRLRSWRVVAVAVRIVVRCERGE